MSTGTPISYGAVEGVVGMGDRGGVRGRCREKRRERRRERRREKRREDCKVR